MFTRFQSKTTASPFFLSRRILFSPKKRGEFDNLSAFHLAEISTKECSDQEIALRYCTNSFSALTKAVRCFALQTNSFLLCVSRLICCTKFPGSSKLWSSNWQWCWHEELPRIFRYMHVSTHSDCFCIQHQPIFYQRMPVENSGWWTISKRLFTFPYTHLDKVLKIHPSRNRVHQISFGKLSCHMIRNRIFGVIKLFIWTFPKNSAK